jgi:hypothetical protein
MLLRERNCLPSPAGRVAERFSRRASAIVDRVEWLDG